MEARTGKHVLRWCIRHHKTGALDFTACRARIRVRACAHTRTRTSSDKINSATKGTDTGRDGRCDYAHADNTRVTRACDFFIIDISSPRRCRGAALPQVRAAIKFAIFTSRPARRISKTFPSGSLSLSPSLFLSRLLFFSGARGRSFIYRRRGALCAAARGIFENNLWPRPQTSRLRCGERPARAQRADH